MAAFHRHSYGAERSSRGPGSTTSACSGCGARRAGADRSGPANAAVSRPAPPSGYARPTPTRYGRSTSSSTRPPMAGGSSWPTSSTSTPVKRSRCGWVADAPLMTSSTRHPHLSACAGRSGRSRAVTGCASVERGTSWAVGGSASPGGPRTPDLVPDALLAVNANEHRVHGGRCVGGSTARLRGLSAPVLQLPQPQRGAAKPEALGDRQAGGLMGCLLRRAAGLDDPVAKRCGQQGAQAGNVLDWHPEGPHAAVVVPHAQHQKVLLGVPGDAQAGVPLVEEDLPAGRQGTQVLHSASVGLGGATGKTCRLGSPRPICPAASKRPAIRRFAWSGCRPSPRGGQRGGCARPNPAQ